MGEPSGDSNQYHNDDEMASINRKGGHQVHKICQGFFSVMEELGGWLFATPEYVAVIVVYSVCDRLRRTIMFSSSFRLPTLLWLFLGKQCQAIRCLKEQAEVD